MSTEAEEPVETSTVDGDRPAAGAEEAFEGFVTVPRRNPWVLGALAVVTCVYLTVAAVLSAQPSFRFAELTLQVLLASTCASLLWTSWRKNLRPWRALGTVRATRAGLCLDDGPLVPSAALRDGVTIPRQGAPILVRIRRWRQPAIELEMESADDAQALLRVLGLGVGQAVATFDIGSRAAVHPAANPVALGVFTLLAPVFVTTAGWAVARGDTNNLRVGLVVPLVALLVLMPLAIPSVLTIGSEGLLVRWLGTRRLIRFADVVSIERRESKLWRTVHLDVKLRSGRIVVLTPNPRTPDCEAIVERFRDGLSACRGDATVEASLGALARRDRSVPAWITALRSLGAGANVTHRIAPVARETLFRIVEDAGAEPEARAAAAVALTGERDGTRRARLLAAARSVATPNLRVALEAAAADADEAALAEALAAVEAAAATRREAEQWDARPTRRPGGRRGRPPNA